MRVALALLLLSSCASSPVADDPVGACFLPTAQQIQRDCTRPEDCVGTYWQLSCDVWTF